MRQAAEDVLREGETLSGLVESSLRAQIELRRSQEAFVARGLASAEKARRTGNYVTAATVLGKLDSKLSKARKARP